MKPAVALFGEAEKGSYDTAYYCRCLVDLHHYLGDINGRGMTIAIKSLLHDVNVVYFRVKEEGYCIDSYLFGLHFLNTQTTLNNIIAIALPGVGDQHIIEASLSLCQKHKSLLLFSDQDFYDLLTFNVLF